MALCVFLPDDSLNPSAGPLEILECPLISATTTDIEYFRNPYSNKRMIQQWAEYQLSWNNSVSYSVVFKYIFIVNNYMPSALEVLQSFGLCIFYLLHITDEQCCINYRFVSCKYLCLKPLNIISSKTCIWKERGGRWEGKRPHAVNERVICGSRSIA